MRTKKGDSCRLTRFNCLLLFITFLIIRILWESAIVENSEQYSPSQDWDYYPVSPRIQSFGSDNQLSTRAGYGILMGGTSDFFSQQASQSDDLSLVLMSTCVAKLYAMRHGYAFHLVKNLEEVSSRSYGGCSAARMSAWHKIQLVRTFLPDVDMLLWLDLDALIVRPSVPLSHMLTPLHREREDLGAWMCASSGPDQLHRNITGTAATPFFYASRDVNPRYNINLNTGVFAVRNAPIAFDFLARVWAVGDDANAFKKHDAWWRSKTPCSGYWGWPWEQGAVWDVLADTQQLRFLRGTVFLPSRGKHALNSVTDSGLVPGEDFPFALHGKGHGAGGMLAPRYIARTLLSSIFQTDSQREGPLSSWRVLAAECPEVAAQEHLLVNVSDHYAAVLRKMMTS